MECREPTPFRKAAPPPLPPRLASTPRPAKAKTEAEAKTSFSTEDFALGGLVQSSPDRKSRAWPKAADEAADGNNNVVQGSRSGSGGGGGTNETPAPPAEAGTVEASNGGGGRLGSTFLGSTGVWKKARAAAANATAAATTTAKAVNSEVGATAAAAVAGFASTGGIPWVGPRGSWVSSNSGGLGVGRGQEGHAERDKGKGQQVEQEDKEQQDGEEKEDGEEPPFVTISVGDVSCFLPNVHWSVQMHQKRFLRVGDSGSVK